MIAGVALERISFDGDEFPPGSLYVVIDSSGKDFPKSCKCIAPEDIALQVRQ